MTRFRLAALIATLALSAAACAPIEPATRNASEVTALDEIVVDGSAPVAEAPRYKVEAVQVVVPEKLRVSEANLYYPLGDIIWHGDAAGDRHAQVQAIFAEAASRATREMTEGQPVVVDLQVMRFHALSPITRYTIGGTYGVRFALTLRDAETGAVVAGPKVLDHGFKASGGQRAVEEEARGYTQKVAVTEFLAEYLNDEIARMSPATAPAAAPDALLAAK